MAAVILAFAMTGCIALSAVSDLVSNFLSLVVMVIARIILQFCDLIMNPLLEITQMTTEKVAEYIPGFAMSGDGVGGYFAKAIMVIATTIAGALIAVRIISYLLEIADGARTESVAKLIWNAVFGMVLTLTGSHFLQLMFDEIISPLTKALSEGVSGGGLGDFSFEKAGMSIIDLTEFGDTTETIIAWMGGFVLAQAAALVVSVVLLFLIWWNLVKLVLECAERYIICVFTILLSPLAFATATNERTKDTAINWMQMFWSQCVLLILNIWVVGIARTALDIGLVGASIDSVVKWGLITYAYLKIAQKLDDLLAKAGFRITSTTGLDPMSEAIGAFSVLKTGAHDILSLAGGVAGRGRAAFEALSSFIGGADNSPPIATNPVTPAGPGGAPSGSSSDFNKYGKVSFGDKEKADRFVRSTNAERSDIYKNPGETFNSNSNRQAMANALDELGFDGGKVSQGTVEDLAPDNAIKGAVNGKVTYRDENGKITGVSGFRYSSDESGTTATKTSDLAISPDGQSAILTTDKGKFRLENTGRTAANGSQEWTATRMTDGKGRNLGDVIPDTKNSTSFSVPAGQLNKYGADGAAAIAARSAMEGKNLDYLTRTTDSALNKHDQEQAAAVARDAKQAEAQKQFDTAKENYAGRFQMSNEQRAAEMLDPDSAVDYNSPESLAAMQDTLANADPALAEQFANGAKVTGVDMAMGRDDMPDGALTVTVGDGNTTDTYMVSNPKSSLTDEEAAQIIASGQLPNETAQNAENADGVAGGPNNASAAENGTDAAKTEAAMPDEDGNIAYNSLAGDDNEQEVTGEEVGDTVGMTSEAFEAMHTPMTWMDEPEADESEAGAPPTMWEYFAAMFSGRYSRNNSAQPTYVHVVNPDGVNYKSGAAAPNVANAAPTPQNATATAPASPNNSDSAANDSTASVESPAGNAPGEEVAGPAKQATSHGSADAEYTGSETPTGNGAINEGSSSVGSEVQLVDDSSDTVQTNAPAQTENAAGAAANDSATGDASADYAEPPADAGNASGNGAVTENSGSADSETQFTDDSSATVQANAPTSHADDVSGDGSADYVEPPANAENISDGGAAPVVQHTDSESVGNESDDSDAPSGYVGGTTDVDAGSADSEASPMDSNSTTVETQAPASRADRTVDTNDETAGEAGFDYAEPPADAGSASNDVATPSAQRTDSDATGEGNTGFAGGNGGGGNYSSDEETAPATQGAKAPADEGDSDIGEPPAKGESSSDVGGAAGRTTSSADDSDDSDDSDAGSGSFGGSNGSSHDENPGSGASGSGGDSNGGAAASAVQYQSGGDNSSDVGDSFTDNEGATASATAAPETQGNDAVSLANAGSGNESTIGQAAPTKASASTDTNTSKREEKAAQNDSQNSFDGNADGSDYSDSTAVKDSTPVHEQSVEKPPVDGTQFYADTSRGNSFATSGKSSTEPRASSAEYSASSGPEIRPLSHVSIKAFNDTNGFVESDGIGRIQVTRVSVDPDTGVTQWRIMQKLDADGNVPETPDVMNIERSAKYNKQTRRYEPETFEGIARQLGKVDDYESVGPDTDESYKRRNRNSSQDRTQSAARSDSQPQQKNAYEGKSFRERNSRNERNERNNRFQQMMQGNKNRSNGSKNKKDKPSK